MGLFDNVESMVRRGTAAASRTAESANIKIKLGDLMKQRQGLAAQLGASLYEETRTRPEFRAGREQIYDAIAGIDQQRAALEQQLAQIEAAARAAQRAAVRYVCPQCGSSVSATDAFCSGCGLPIAEVMRMQRAPMPQGMPVPAGRPCPSCGAPVGPDDAFCMNCGVDLRTFAAPQAPSGMPSEPEVEAPNAGEVAGPEHEAAAGPVATEPEPEATAEVVAAEPEPVQEADAEPPQAAMVYCTSCGSPQPAGVAFCGNCGAKMQQ